LYVFVPSYAVLLGAMMTLARPMYEAAARLNLIPLQTLPPLLASTPRNVIDTGRTKRVVIDTLGMFGIMALSVQLAAMYPTARKWAALRARGTETTGTITGRHERNTGRAVIRSMTYRFTTAQGEIVDSAESVSRATYDRIRAGDTIPITYLESATWAHLAAHKRELTWHYLLDRLSPIAMILGGLLIMGILAAVFLQRIRALMIARARDGIATLAVITNVNRQRLEYEYDTPQGRQSGALVIAKKKPRVQPQPGEKIAVLYDAAKPAKSMPVAGLVDVRFG
jgi:hypothetical protein